MEQQQEEDLRTKQELLKSHSSSNASLPSKTITIQNITYTLRGLQTLDEIDTWSNFCASVFSYKANPPPPSYFKRHYVNDACLKQLDWIQVATVTNNDNQNDNDCDNNKNKAIIVASCRIFHRIVSVPKHKDNNNDNNDNNSKKIQVGGIGEVCTDTNHQRRGLSTMLLQRCIQIMQSKPNIFQLSLLHAGPQFFSYYQKFDYQTTLTKWTNVQFQLLSTNKININIVIVRLAQFPNDTLQLQALYQKYTQERFVGSIVRDESYWNDYLSIELQGSLFVLQDVTSNSILAWCSVRPRGDGFQLREFGINLVEDTTTTLNNSITISSSATTTATTNALQILLPHALSLNNDDNDTTTNSNDDDTTTTTITLQIPTTIVQDIDPNCIASQTACDDLGWMYKTIQSDQAYSISNAIKVVPHLIWPADSF